MARKVRSDEVLRKTSVHLRYEFGTFTQLAQMLNTGAFGTGTLNNALLESFTVHSRLLLDFFFDDKPRHDDEVVADDFFGCEGKWPGMRGTMPPILQTVDRRVGKEVAHLTYSRLDVTPDEKLWTFPAIVQAIEKVWNTFITQVPPSRLDQDLSKIMTGKCHSPDPRAPKRVLGAFF
jgi:hypothetical protein